MGKTTNGALSRVEAAWIMADKLMHGPLSLEEAAQIVAGCGNGNRAAWYELSDDRRSQCRKRARAILRAGVDSGAVRPGVVTVNGKSEDIWEATRLYEIPY